ncbi:hypothetical protein ACIBCT_35660 [Streptosporangium sp. NPDC050855]|uniref:hypothetical protein n=1 Tax=Streptosporangium sp. NPDC050855 TaxID=3366194 RepID=UPI0037A3BD8F
MWADHMNRVQEEVEAIQRTLGIVPQRASNNPGGLTPDHGTVAARIQSVARGEHVPFFRGSVREFDVTTNAWQRPTLRADEDPFGMSTGTGIRLNESGLWCFTIKADWQTNSDTQRYEAIRSLRLEINGNDIGVRHVLEEGSHNRNALHQHITWTETLAKGTRISMGIRTDLNASTRELDAHCYMRAHLIRCHPHTGEGESVPFDQMPDQKPGDKPPVCIPKPRPDECRYTVYCCYEGLRTVPRSDINRGGSALSRIQIIDNSHRFYDMSPHPIFTTLDEAMEYRDELWYQMTGWRGAWQEADNVVESGIHWPST